MSKRLLSGHEVVEQEDEELKESGLDIFIHRMVRIKPEGWLYPGTTPAFLDRIYNMEFRPDDVIITGFPKSGTTWLQEIIWTILHNPNLDNPRAKESLWLRSIVISQDMIFDLKALGSKTQDIYLEKLREVCPGRNQEEGVMLHLAEAEPSPRVLKCHFPFPLLPKDILDRVKVVYVARNPKDMFVSLYHFAQFIGMHPDQSAMERFFKSLIKNQIMWTPYWEHVKEAWQKRHHPNLLFLFYEEMKADIMKEMARINDFLGAGLSQETLEAVRRHTSISAMKSRGEPVNDKIFEKKDDRESRFFRKGITGDWKNYFSPKMQKEFDEWIEKNLAGTDLSLSWALAH